MQNPGDTASKAQHEQPRGWPTDIMVEGRLARRPAVATPGPCTVHSGRVDLDEAA